MLNIKNKTYCPTLEEIGEYVSNSAFTQFCEDVKARYHCKEKIEFSSCSWEYGWNVKFKNAGKSLCTIYPRENFFTVLVVVGKKEKTAVEDILPKCTPELREIYKQTQTGNEQKWLMIDIEDNDELYSDVLSLINIRRG